MAETKEKYLLYRGKPMVREGNTICYGSLKDPYILFMLILTTKKDEASGAELPDNILVQILSTDTSKPAHERVVKQGTKTGLFDALEIGTIWLSKYNSEAKN